jgi:hypothetical protein
MTNFGNYEASPDRDAPQDVADVAPESTEDWADFELRFGKYKGMTLGELITKPTYRGYLRYILRWDKLRLYSRAYIERALEEYEKVRPPPTKTPRMETKQLPYGYGISPGSIRTGYAMPAGGAMQDMPPPEPLQRQMTNNFN